MCNNKVVKEKARVNLRETRVDIFPYEEYQVYIMSDDSEPPHLHIVKEGWDVTFLIETGALHKIYTQGQNVSTYDYMLNNVGRWLDKQCSIMPKITNRECAAAVWLQLH